VGDPVISIACEGKSAFTVPFPAMRWQSRHQQILEFTGSAVSR